MAVAVKASTEHRAGNIGNLDVWQDLIVYPSYEVRLTSIRANTIVRGFKSVNCGDLRASGRRRSQTKPHCTLVIAQFAKMHFRMVPPSPV